MVLSGSLTILWASATVPIWWSSSGPGISTSASLEATRTSRRSAASTSSMSLMERSWPTVSGIMVSGKTTVSRRGSTGSSPGSSFSSGTLTWISSVSVTTHRLS